MSGVFTYLRTCFSEAHLQNERTSTNVKSYQKACNMRLPVYVYFISFTRWDKQCKKRKLKTCQTRSFTGMLISSTYSQNEKNFASVKPCKAMPEAMVYVYNIQFDILTKVKPCKAMSEAITSTHFLLFPSRSPRLNFIRLDSDVDQGKTMSYQHTAKKGIFSNWYYDTKNLTCFQPVCKK